MNVMTEDEIILEIQTLGKKGLPFYDEIKRLKEILESNPNSQACLDRLATLYREQEKYCDAAKYLEKLVHLYPNQDDEELLKEARKRCNQKLNELRAEQEKRRKD